MSVRRLGLLLAAVFAFGAAAFVAHGSSARTDRTGVPYCPSLGAALQGVYHPTRLVVQGPCQRASGTVRTVRHEQDGDLHIDVQVTSTYKKLLNYKNYSLQHGWLVVEFMARDGGHLPEPSVGDAISLVGAWVFDSEHGWNEIHPVWHATLHGKTYTSGPQYGGSPAGDRSKNAEKDCRDQNGQVCVGYSHHSQPQPPAPSPAPSSSGSGSAPAGATAKCNDGTYSYSQHRRGTCSHHGGVAVWLKSVPP